MQEYMADHGAILDLGPVSYLFVRFDRGACNEGPDQ